MARKAAIAKKTGIAVAVKKVLGKIIKLGAVAAIGTAVVKTLKKE
jgi:hypothetical protein